jgi:amphi-Trp domain-containing protein
MAKPKKTSAATTQPKKAIKKQKATRPEKAKVEAAGRTKLGKSRVKFESSLSRLEAVTYFDAIVAGLKKGALNFKQGEDAVAFSLPDHVEIEVKAERKKGRENISFDITWHAKETADGDELKISSS